jgi:hypothetical protein
MKFLLSAVKFDDIVLPQSSCFDDDDDSQLKAEFRVTIGIKNTPFLFSVFVVLGFWSWITGGDSEYFSSPPRPGRLWGLPSLLSNAYWGLFPWG